MPGWWLLSLLIVCITLPGWLTGFWTKKDDGSDHNNSLSSGEDGQTIALTANVEKTMEELRLYSFEREVLSSALTTIFEAEVKGILKTFERDRLADRYKKELESLDRKIEERRKVAELVNLEKEKKELQSHFSQKMREIEQKIEELRSLIGSLPPLDLRTLDTVVNSPDNVTPLNREPDVTPENAMDKTIERTSKTKTKGEEKMEALREEVLRAIERLEQIEGEV